jgi:hypothetical protein
MDNKTMITVNIAVMVDNDTVIMVIIVVIVNNSVIMTNKVILQ